MLDTSAANTQRMNQRSPSNKQATVTAADKRAAENLKYIWDSRKSELGLTQEIAGAEMGMNQSAISQYLNGRIPIGLEALLKWSSLLGCAPEDIRTDVPLVGFAMSSAGAPRRRISPPETPIDYVRVDQLDASADMGDGHINDDFPDVIRSVDFTLPYVRSLIGCIPEAGRLKLITGRGDSMMPTIHPGDVVVVDTGCTSFDGDGIYLVNSGHGQQIKRLQDKGGIVHVVSDNTLYTPVPVNDRTQIGGKVYLRNRLERLG